MIYSKYEAFRQGAMIAVAGFFIAFNMMAQQPTITNAADGSGSAAFWYFGGLPSVDNYFVQWRLNMQPPNNGDPTPSIVWSTDRTDLVSIAPAPDGLSALLTSLKSSDTVPQSVATYNINITVTFDGTPSAPFPVYINTPFSMTLTSTGQYCTGGSCDCNASGFYPGDTGYVTRVLNSVQDILGNNLVPIRVHETLEKRQWLAAGWTSVGLPSASGWSTARWNSDNTFNDFFWICGSGTLPSPPPTSSGSGTTTLFNETQKFWIGTDAITFTGTCVQRGIVTLYTDHGTSTSNQVPGIPSTICNAGSVIN